MSRVLQHIVSTVFMMIQRLRTNKMAFTFCAAAGCETRPFSETHVHASYGYFVCWNRTVTRLKATAISWPASENRNMGIELLAEYAIYCQY